LNLANDKVKTRENVRGKIDQGRTKGKGWASHATKSGKKDPEGDEKKKKIGLLSQNEGDKLREQSKRSNIARVPWGGIKQGGEKKKKSPG